MQGIVFTLLFFTSTSWGSTQLEGVLKKYSQASAVEIHVKKTDEKITLGSKSTSSGELKYSKNKIYLVLSGDKKTEFIFKDKKIWLIEYPDQDFNPSGKRKVTVLTKNTPALLKGLLNLFSESKKFLKEFEIISEKKNKNELIVDLKPKQKNLKSFVINADIKRKVITKIVFIDDVDTKTTLDLSDLRLNKKIKKSIFDYQAVKSDEVILQ